MKATMLLDDKAGWELTIRPETDVEEAILQAAHKGIDVKVSAYKGDDDDVLRISGTGRSHVSAAQISPK
jgi:hypothetical protein